MCVGTYNRGELITERCLPSILAQTYHNLEIIVIGDACTDDTFDRIKKFSDKRLKYFNLKQRGNYPRIRKFRWMVAGSIPFNHALRMTTGDFITHLDDDDEYSPIQNREAVKVHTGSASGTGMASVLYGES